jgi:Mlc titration factor MtfA (ptsG expression regulator)
VAGWLDILRGKRSRPRDIPERLWQDTLVSFPFLARLSGPDLDLLRQLARQFLAQKEFHGAAGFQISDEVALAIAAQACLPVLHIESPLRGLDWYRDFVGIVVHAGPVRAKRVSVDETGIVHNYEEVLTGEAMQDGPVTLSWQDVRDAGQSAHDGYNVVIHEFVHKIDMRDGSADGCPPLPADFMGAPSAGHARRNWQLVLTMHYQDFCDKLSLAERFGGAAQWLDPYAAESIDEFFAVASEAYFVNPENFARDFAALVPVFDAFFKPSRGSV